MKDNEKRESVDGSGSSVCYVANEAMQCAMRGFGWILKIENPKLILMYSTSLMFAECFVGSISVKMNSGKGAVCLAVRQVF